MAITDYIYQQETVMKKDFEAWLIAKMQAAGWQQIGSNPPKNPTDTTITRFYMMKGKRDSDNMDTYVGINGAGIRRLNSTTYSAQMNIVPFLDYTPGAADTAGSTSKGTWPITAITSGPGTSSFQWSLFGTYNAAIYSAETPLNVRFCITGHNVSLVVRTPINYSEGGGYLFFGLPDILGKEKNGGVTVAYGSCNGTSANGLMYITDTPLNVVSSIPNSITTVQDSLGVATIAPGRSPDVHGQFPLLVAYGQDSPHGIRTRHPSAFFVLNGGLLDGDLIQYQGMTFEVLLPQYPMSGGFRSGYVVYRIA